MVLWLLTGQRLDSELGAPFSSCENYFSSTILEVRDDAWVRLSLKSILDIPFVVSKVKDVTSDASSK